MRTRGLFFKESPYSYSLLTSSVFNPKNKSTKYQLQHEFELDSNHNPSL